MGANKERFRNAFGVALEEQMRRRGLTQTALAARLGNTRAYVSQTMTGAKAASPELADRIIEALHGTEDDLLDLHQAAAESRGYKIRKGKQ